MATWLTSLKTALLILTVLGGTQTPLAHAADAAQSNTPNHTFWRSVFERPAEGGTSRTDDDRVALKTKLGQQLFNDPRLSGGADMSCATCHDPALAFTDGLAKARGRGGSRLRRNTPSIYNLASSSRFNWDASANSLESQAIGPITHPNEMNGSFESIIARLGKDTGLRKSFNGAFGSPGLSKERILEAVSTYVRSLVSPQTRFDAWVSGDETALSAAEKRGFTLFVGKAGCVSCHSGWRFTDDSLHDIGVKSDDPGNSAVSGGHPKIPSFKTPGLRELSKTAPYMHNGSIATLEGVIEHYSDGFIDRPSLSSNMRRDLELTPQETSDLVDFLLSLSSGE